MSMKKLIKYATLAIITILIGGTTFLHLAPVSFDAGTCSGGYKRWVADKHSDELIDIFLSEIDSEIIDNYELLSTPDEVSETVKWDGRNIKLTLKIGLDNKIHTVEYSGQRYWIESYNWGIENIRS